MKVNSTKGLIAALPSHFTKVKYLSEGGMGVVFRAFDEKLKRNVAIKVVHRLGKGSEDYRIRLRREAKSLCALRHPNVVRAFDYHEDEQITFLVLEFLEGITLVELAKDSSMSINEIVHLMAQLADGLAAIHAAKLLHRDIKPANIMVTNEGQPLFIDFGLTITTEKLDETRLTRTDCLVGTLGYLAPEVIRGTDNSEQSDVYQLGVVFHELLTGNELVDGDRFNALLRGQAYDIPLPSKLGKGDEELDQIILNAIAFDHKLRTQKAADLAKQCKQWLEKHDEARRPLETLVTASYEIPEPTSPTSKVSQKKPIWPLFAVPLLLVICIFFPSRTQELSLSAHQVGTDWFSFKAQGKGNYKLYKANENKELKTGLLANNDEVLIRRLTPSTKYKLVFNGKEVFFLTTSQVNFSKTPRAFALKKAFYISYKCNLKYSGLQLIVGRDEQHKEIAASSNKVIVEDVKATSEGTVPWKILLNNRLLAKGKTYPTRDFVPQFAGEDSRPQYNACWLGDKLLLGCQNWQINLVEPGPQNPQNRNDLLTKMWNYQLTTKIDSLRRFRWLIPYSANRAVYANWAPISSTAHIFHITTKSNAPKETVVEFGQSFEFNHSPTKIGDHLVLQGVAGKKAHWLFIDPNERKLVRTVAGKKVKERPLPKKSSVYSIDYGRSLAFDRGWGFISPPYCHDGKIYSLLAKSKTRKKLWTKASLICLRKKDGSYTKPVSLGEFSTWIGCHPFGQSKDEADFTIAGRHTIHRFSSKKQSLEPLFQLPKEYQKGYFASPSIEVKGKHYAFYLSDNVNSKMTFQSVFNHRKLHLVSWKAGETCKIYKTAILKARESTYQVPSLQRLFLEQNRYLIGVTPLSLVVVDLAEGYFGSVFFAGELIENVALNSEALIYVGLRGTRISVLPIELILHSNRGKLQ